jgi:hypothetical protein
MFPVYVRFCRQKGSMQIILIKKCFLFTVDLSLKVVHNRVEKFSPGCSKVAGDARPNRPVEIATEATVQRVEALIPADRRKRQTV